MRNIDPVTLEAMRQRVVRFMVLVKIDFPGATLAFNSGLDTVQLNGDTYTGFGNLGSVSGLDESGDISPNQYAIKVSGVSDEVLAAATDSQYLNNPAIVYLATLDADYQITGDPFIWFRGLTDSVDIAYGQESSVTINVRDRLTDWQRPKIERYTDADQQRMHPGDKGFEFVTEIASKDVNWPAESWFKKNQ